MEISLDKMKEGRTTANVAIVSYTHLKFMKKLALAICLLLASIAAQAQFELSLIHIDVYKRQGVIG